MAAFDYSNALDTLGAKELMVKLLKMGVGDSAVLWFKDYLSHRCQQVRYGAARSSQRDVTFGVPQGSLLGPVLFTALVYDLPGELGLEDKDGITMYADDVALWSAHKDSAVVKNKLEELSARLMSYSLKNSLSLNSDKTQVLWSGLPAPPPVQIGPALVQPQDKLLLLGVSFDKKLTITPHLRFLPGKARSLVALARRLLLHLPRDHRVLEVMSSLVTGQLGYCCALFPPRLREEDPACQLLQATQTGVNDIARLGH